MYVNSSFAGDKDYCYVDLEQIDSAEQAVDFFNNYCNLVITVCLPPRMCNTFYLKGLCHRASSASKLCSMNFHISSHQNGTPL